MTHKSTSLRILAPLAGLAGLAWAGPACAHVGHGAQGFAHGLAHPLGGLDHMLAMVGVGLLACVFKGRTLWLAPLSFVAMMLVGALVGAEHLPFAGLERAIAASVILIGALIALGPRIPLPAALAGVATAGLLHGYAHGAELAPGVDALAYGAGFVLATIAMHAVGVSAGLVLARRARVGLLRASGAALVAAGVALTAAVV